MSLPMYSPPLDKWRKKYGPALSNWDPEKCPRCGKPMVRGLLIALCPSYGKLIFEPHEKSPLLAGGYETSREITSYGKTDIRAYMCEDCDIWVCYGQDPKTGEMFMSYKEPKEPAKDEKKN